MNPSDYQVKLLALYRAHVDPLGSLDDAHEAFEGVYETPEEWARDHLINLGVFAGSDPLVLEYFDFASYSVAMAASGQVTFALAQGRREDDRGLSLWVFT